MKVFNAVRKYGARVAVPVSAGALALLPALSRADGAIDITAATGAISAAQTAVLAVLAAMIVMAGAIWAVRKVLRLFGR